MNKVQPKKRLGQHFLTDKNIAEKIVNSLTYVNYNDVLEIGPGMGVLTDFLFKNSMNRIKLIDIDTESVLYLKQKYPEHTDNIIEGDFLKLNFDIYFQDSFAVIGNFPYNISSQILFKVLDYKKNIPELVGMFQKEVAERCVAQPKSKAYGIVSVLLQAYYDVEYLFTVKPSVFNPPPKVQSAVIRMKRKSNYALNCNEKLFWQIVKAGFNQRRKTLKNALSVLLEKEKMTTLIFERRAETLSVEEFIALTVHIENVKQY